LDSRRDARGAHGAARQLPAGSLAKSRGGGSLRAMNTTRTLQSALAGSEVEAEVCKVRLLFSGGDGVVRAPPCVLRPGPRLIIGRAVRPGAGISLPGDDSASRQHAELELSESGQLHLRDLGSKNGTFVDGQRIRETELVPAALIRVGTSFL